MTLIDLFSLFNIAENTLSNFTKILLPLGIILLILIIIKWLQSIKRSGPDIVVIRKP